MKIGIDKIGFAMPEYYLDICDLAVARGVEPDKFTKGLLQLEMSIPPASQDIVTLGAQAAYEILDKDDLEKIDMIIVGTESGVDQSKAAAVFIHNLLDMNPFVRAIEVKEACYGATAGLDFAKNHVLNNPDSKVLVIASDIAKYGKNSSGESTQGAGSCAMLVAKNPRVLELNNDNICQTRDVMDFWRPNYSNYAFVEGKFSTEQYLDCLMTTWGEYEKRAKVSLEDFSAVCLHLPYPKLGLKGLNALLENKEDTDLKERLLTRFDESMLYSQRVGNIYTGSLFLGLLSLIENSTELNAGDKIVLYSYGSGAVAEIFSMTLVEGYRDHLRNNRFDDFNRRKQITVEQYEEMFFRCTLPDKDGNLDISDIKDDSMFVLEKIENHKRIYKRQ
ncbi:hydroxymethylglutaryl-CoA synthase [Gemella bergeri ATCC 700627]|uniref:Hydroxymethylglutaryl-CoA synthase n=1 Tax=Gemella bergeri ATCC 700627 TaxID=1321820 RepID=U2QSP8_9BACL|nr:hydroxymethylglutaryl-CoA synthase [Gemella bergeri]ERK59531.1 hydroxymethylglutaryl-CoA synthase [Gemella bergeri ATCC 700627]